MKHKAFGRLLRATANYGAPEIRAALELLALTFVWPGELRAAEWAEFDLEAGVWAIPAERMKMKRPHRGPLAPRATAILRELQTITGRGKFLFPSVRSAARCMSENTINAALCRLGFKKDEMTAHGFRAAASSMLNESGLSNPDAVERQLAHVGNDSVRRAYARADFWEERTRMKAWWADRCDEMRRVVLWFLLEHESPFFEIILSTSPVGTGSAAIMSRVFVCSRDDEAAAFGVAIDPEPEGARLFGLHRNAGENLLLRRINAGRLVKPN